MSKSLISVSSRVIQRPAISICRRVVRRPLTIEALAPRVSTIQKLATPLKNVSDSDLTTQSQTLRESTRSHSSSNVPHPQDRAFAFVVEAIRRIHGKTLHDVQLLGGLVLASGAIAEMATGEGKTLTAIAPAYWHALDGQGIHVMTSNSYLAQRDYELSRPVFELLGMTSAVLPERAFAEIKRPLYDCDIVYGNGFEFGFDYLKDQIALRHSIAAPLGERLLQQLRAGRPQRLTMQRGLHYAIVDEADHVLLDDAVSPLLISETAEGEAPDAEAHRVALKLACELIEGTDFIIHPEQSRLQLTPHGRNRIHQTEVSIPAEVLVRPWAQYVETALKARHIFQVDQQYVIEDGQIQLVDHATGRIMPDRTWSDGLHQAVLAKEHLAITPETRSLARITRQRFLRLYKSLSGMTGTATEAVAEFRSIYAVNVILIPVRLPTRRHLLSTRFFSSASFKWKAVVDDIQNRHLTGQPILVGTRSIEDSQNLARQLEACGLRFELLTGRQTKSEADIIAHAGERNAIMIATNLAGRGTDIVPTAEALELGGLHVICCEPDESYRVDRQLIGRSARQGQVGSAQCFVSAEDDLIVRRHPRLSRLIQNRCDSSGESSTDFSNELRQLQIATEQLAAESRRTLLDHDLQRETTLARFLGVQSCSHG